MTASPLFVVGDVHGHRDVLASLLRDAGLIDANDRWSGGDAKLWLLGDLVDRGPDGVGAIELVMSLERDGDVRCLLGNHEVLLVGALLAGDTPLGHNRESFFDVWQYNGGQLGDLQRVSSEHLDWLNRRPAVAVEGEWVLLHADTPRYLDYGTTVREIDDRVGEVLLSADPTELAGLLDRLSDRFGLTDETTLQRVLDTFGVRRVVHGHTPIAAILDASPSSVREPLVTCGGRVVNVDHCLFGGGAGFVTRLDELYPV